ncbi:hypothetical protein QE152_g37558 [Popillia japonica]
MDIPIEEASIELARVYICYRGLFIITAIIGNTIAEIGQGEIRYDINEPTNLVLSVSGSALTATWDFTPVKTSCRLAFFVRIHRGDIINTVTAFNTYTEFQLFYCVNTTVYVAATNFIYESEYITATLPEMYPTSLDPVDDITIKRTEMSAVISWVVLLAITQCTDLYIVSARNEETGEESQCQGTMRCEISLVNGFCPTTKFTIGPASLSGDKVLKTYSCAEDVLV